MDINRFKLNEYAIAILLALHNNRERLISVKVISEITALNKTTINKILFLLLKTGFIQSTKGKLGGYKLIKQPKEILLYTIISAIHCQVKELHKYQDDNKEKNRIMNKFVSIRDEMCEVIQRYTLEDFI